MGLISRRCDYAKNAWHKNETADKKPVSADDRAGYPRRSGHGSRGTLQHDGFHLCRPDGRGCADGGCLCVLSLYPHQCRFRRHDRRRFRLGAVPRYREERPRHRKEDHGQPGCRSVADVRGLHGDRYGVHPAALIPGRSQWQHPDLCRKISADRVRRFPVREFLPERQYGHSRRGPA